ncbi:DUF3987 domain-containing protein [bacterium]|nr:DUF3987 domain-containing protein [bacterium]
MPVLASLGIVSVALSKKFVVSPKPDWIESVNIYCQIAMQPASNKSQTLKFLKSPVDEWEQKEIERIRPEREAALSHIKMQEIELKKLSKTLLKAKAKQDEIENAKKEIPELESKLRELRDSLPIIPQSYTTDVTSESLATLLDEQKGIVAIISDEGGVTEVLSGLYSNGSANVDILVEYIKANPKLRGKQTGELLIDSLRESYPCTQR